MGGFFSDIGKTFNKAFDDITPDVTVGDPTKLITQPIEGAFNAGGRVVNGAVNTTGETLNNAVSQVGEVLANPAAGAVLGAAGAYFGIPNLGNLAGNLSQNKYPEPELGAGRSIELPFVKDNKNLIIGSVIGGAILLITVFLYQRKKGRK